MDDLMNGIGNSNGMDDISNMNALAQQAAEEGALGQESEC